LPPHAIPFIVGAPRSGTTLLRLMLDAHPEIAIPAETQFYPAVIAVDERRDDWLDRVLSAMTSNHSWGDFRIDAIAFERQVRASDPAAPGDVLRTFYRTYAARFGKRAWGDKWPGNVLRMRDIARLLPEARFVHIIRDGRDVAVSLRDMWWHPCDSYADCIRLWAERIRAAREQAATPLPYLEVRYEALVSEPRETLARVCAFIGFPFDEAMLTYHRGAAARHAEVADWSIDGKAIPREQIVAVHRRTHEPPSTSRIGTWERAMSEAERAACDHAAGDLLAELGYR
jgi:sulfotransferase family protein